MKNLLIIISVIGLILTIVPSMLVFTEIISLDAHKQLMLIGTIMWFSSAFFWMKEQKL
ncbi:MAG: hypothetical protein WD059_01365 [Balneolaceae bacterium]